MSGLLKPIAKVIGTITGAEAQKKAAEQSAAATLAAAEKESAAQVEAANKAAQATRDAQAAAQAFELQRSADAALAQQNLTTSSAAPTVQLADQSDEGSASAARKRRATFRPEYATGVSL